ncbi:MerR family transcriptional regulator [Erysipelotrichaceae bacterium 7770_A6]|jgi:DNA-binding transcriptional MerR regulator|nr:MerR family transcriptional regulator [Erysipelotrichaceae bacterium 7770_A6]
MKINELSKLTAINTETIRMYRNLGFLHPEKLENGYYDYSMQDYASIIHLKKLRAFDFSLQDIHESEHLDSLEEYLSRFKKVEIELHKEIESIQKKIDFIHFEMEHVLSTISTYDANVSLNQSVDTKIDIYPPFKKNQLVDPTTYSNYFLYTTTPIFISKDILNGDIKDEIIETNVGIGTYLSIYQKMHVEIPDNAITIPNGLCITQIVYMKDLTHINILDIAPMINYAKKLNKKFISDTTGYLVGVTYEDKDPVYIMRIRACIETNDVVSSTRIR